MEENLIETNKHMSEEEKNGEAVAGMEPEKLMTEPADACESVQEVGKETETQELPKERTDADDITSEDQIQEDSSESEDAAAAADSTAQKMESGDGVLQGKIEAILFTIGDAVEKSRIAQALEVDTKTVEKLVHSMMEQYQCEDRGIRIIEIDDFFQMCTKADYYDTLIRIVAIPKKHVLTDVLLETLSIVAYKQPITRQEIEAIRGVSCVHAVNKLLEYHLIEEVGRLDAVGRPILFGTTDEFLRSFGVQSTDELPVITPDKIEDFKQQAMEEAQLTFAPVKD